MIYVFLLESAHQRQQHYVGVTHDLKQRLSDPNEGKSPHIRKFNPWHLVVYIGFAEEQTAYSFEKYLKSGSGKASFEKRFLQTKPSGSG